MKCVDRISFPLFPTEEQKQLMIRNCHNARFAYNWGVAKVLECLDRHELPPSRYTLASEFNRFKHTPGYEWLTNNHASQRATKYAIVKQLDNAMQKYLKEHRRPPTFKSKKSGARMSYYTHEETIKFTPGFVKLEGLGMVKCYHDITDLSNIKITEPVVIFDGDNFTVSIGIKYKTPIKQKYHYSDVDIHSQPIGIDIGIRHLAVTSNGDVFDIPDLNKIDKRISKIDRKIDKWRREFRDSYYESLSCDMKTKYPEKTYIKSQNLLKLESKRRKLYRKHCNIRKDIRAKAISTIVKQYPSAIVIEDINFNRDTWKIKGAKKYNKRIMDVSPGDFLETLRKKCEFLDIPLITADHTYPSTKMCSCCGNTVANTLTKDRMFICSECGYTEDRDLNAAYNLRNLASTNIGKKKKKSKKIA